MMKTIHKTRQRNLEVHRKNILLAADGSILPTSQVVPKYIPKEPTKACVTSPLRPAARSPRPLTRRVNSDVSRFTRDLPSDAESDFSTVTTRSGSLLSYSQTSTSTTRSKISSRKSSRRKSNRRESREKPVNIVGPIRSDTYPTLHLVNTNFTNKQPDLEDLSGEESSASEASQVVESLQGQIQSQARKINKLEDDLQNQLKVNGELKKLLVASVGDDLEYRVEKLARDKAQLSAAVGSYSQQLYQDVEDLDRVSIQADLWKSKYLASRVQSEDLSRKLEETTSKYTESVSALEHILDQRQRVINNLNTCQRLTEQLVQNLSPTTTLSLRHDTTFHGSHTTLSVSEHLLDSLASLLTATSQRNLAHDSSLPHQPSNPPATHSPYSASNPVADRSTGLTISGSNEILQYGGPSSRTAAENEAFQVLRRRPMPDTSNLLPPQYERIQHTSDAS